MLALLHANFFFETFQSKTVKLLFVNVMRPTSRHAMHSQVNENRQCNHIPPQQASPRGAGCDEVIRAHCHDLGHFVHNALNLPAIFDVQVMKIGCACFDACRARLAV